MDGIEYDGKFLYAVRGYNMKANEMSAAFGLAQMAKLTHFTQIRKDNVRYFYERLQKASTNYLLPRADYDDMDWLAFPLQHPNRSELIRYLEKNDVQIRVTFAGNVTRHPAYRHLLGDFANADTIMRDGFLLGAHHGLTTKELDRVCELLIKFDKEGGVPANGAS